jgi:hypothetical protein
MWAAFRGQPVARGAGESCSLLLSLIIGNIHLDFRAIVAGVFGRRCARRQRGVG